jgi:hypothetical protein
VVRLKHGFEAKEMKDEEFNPYLWDRSGGADAEVERLEQVLARYRHDEPLRVVAPARRWRLWKWTLAIAAAATCCFAAYIALLPHFGRPGEAWRVASRAGRPLLAGTHLLDDGHLAPGQVLETDATSRAELFAGLLGSITVEPNSRLRMVGSDRDKSHYRLALDHGRISARLWAPPHTFAFETPSATAWDLGCAFTLEVEPSGYGLVRVTSGWVEFEDYDHETLIPAGAVAISLPGRGPGSPFYEDATPAFQTALRRFDFDPLEPNAREAAFATLLGEARSRDVYTLLTLLRVLSPEDRGRVFDRAAALTPPPEGVSREGIVQRNEPMVARWKHSLGYGNAKSWWTHWPDVLR